jgi:hypothetical protein
MEEQVSAVIDPVFIVGPMKAHLPNWIVDYLKGFCEEYAPTAEDYSPYLAGKMSEGRQLGLPVDKLEPNIAELFLKLSYQYMEQLSGQPQSVKLELDQLWLVEQKAGDFNPVHQHGGLLAGIVYLQVPPQCSLESKEGCIDFIFGRHMPATADFCGQRTVLPVVGDMYLFPAWLQHVVYPFKGEGSRLCMPFNVKIV